MPSAIFADYVRALSAFLNIHVDSKCKTWRNVVSFFFGMNKDPALLALTAFAEAFDNVAHPNYPRVSVAEVQKYFDPQFTPALLMENGLEPGQDFLDDEDGLRLTFSALRRLVFRQGDLNLMDSFDFVDNVYQTYVRYTLSMRLRQPSHWALVERVGGFTKTMRPDLPSGTESKPRPATMSTQPRVFCVIKGSHKNISERLARYARLEEQRRQCASQDAQPKLDFSSQAVTPIFEKVLPDIEDEISAALAHLAATHHQRRRPADGQPRTVSLLKRAVLIDPSQSEYTPEMLAGDIAQTRQLLKQGRDTPSAPGSKRAENFSDLAIFERTNGEFMDDFKTTKMTPREEDVCLVNYDDGHSSVQRRISPKWRSLSATHGSPSAPIKYTTAAELHPTRPLVPVAPPAPVESPPITPPTSAPRPAAPNAPTSDKRSKSLALKPLIVEGYPDSSDNEDRPIRNGKRLFQIKRGPPPTAAQNLEKAAIQQMILDNEGYSD